MTEVLKNVKQDKMYIWETVEGGSPIPLCKTESRKNIWPFHASRIITKMFSRSRKNQGDPSLDFSARKA